MGTLWSNNMWTYCVCIKLIKHIQYMYKYITISLISLSIYIRVLRVYSLQLGGERYIYRERKRD